MRKKIYIVLTMLMILALSGTTAACASASKTGMSEAPASPGFAPMPEPSPPPAPDIPSFGGNDSGYRGDWYQVSGAPREEKDVVYAQDEGLVIERMIVRTGDIAILVENIPDAILEITGYAQSVDGYVVSSNTWKENERVFGNISFRIPAKNFDAAMARLRDMAFEVVSESTSSQDVTEEYTDLSAKLKNLEATEVQLLQLMERAETVEEVLNIQRELTRTREEIERIKGRMQYLEQTSETSLINVQLQQSRLDVDFNASRARVETGERIRFESNIIGGFAPYSYQWDFGDGTTSTENYPQHIYKSAGTYTVSLTVTDDRGNEDVEIRKDYINVVAAWDAGNVAGSAWNGLKVLGQTLVNILIWLGIFSPVWIIIGLVVFFIIRKRRKTA